MTQLQVTAIYKVTSKSSNETCWMVPSNSSSDMYKVCFDELSSSWTCECRHGHIQASRGQSATCCHAQAVQTSIKANVKSVVETIEVKGMLNRKSEFKMEQAPSGRLVPMR